MIETTIEKGILTDIDELEQLYNDLNDFLASDINHPGWIKGIYPVRENAESSIDEQNLYVVRHEGQIIGSIILNHHPKKAYETASWGIDSEYSQIFVIHTLVVHPSFLKAGIGKKMIAFACELGKETLIPSYQ